MGIIHLPETVVTARTKNRNLALSPRKKWELERRQNQSQEPECPRQRRARAAVKAVDSRIFAINIARGTGQSSYGHGVEAGRIRKLPDSLTHKPPSSTT